MSILCQCNLINNRPNLTNLYKDQHNAKNAISYIKNAIKDFKAKTNFKSVHNKLRTKLNNIKLDSTKKISIGQFIDDLINSNKDVAIQCSSQKVNKELAKYINNYVTIKRVLELDFLSESKKIINNNINILNNTKVFRDQGILKKTASYMDRYFKYKAKYNIIFSTDELDMFNRFVEAQGLCPWKGNQKLHSNIQKSLVELNLNSQENIDTWNSEKDIIYNIKHKRTFEKVRRELAKLFRELGSSFTSPIDSYGGARRYHPWDIISKVDNKTIDLIIEAKNGVFSKKEANITKLTKDIYKLIINDSDRGKFNSTIMIIDKALRKIILSEEDEKNTKKQRKNKILDDLRGYVKDIENKKKKENLRVNLNYIFEYRSHSHFQNVGDINYDTLKDMFSNGTLLYFDDQLNSYGYPNLDEYLTDKQRLIESDPNFGSWYTDENPHHIIYETIKNLNKVNYKGDHPSIRTITSFEPEKLKKITKNKNLLNIANSLGPGSYIFVLSNAEMKICAGKKNELHHTSLELKDNPGIAAGEILISEEGGVTISNRSGHFKPGAKETLKAIQYIINNGYKEVNSPLILKYLTKCTTQYPITISGQKKIICFLQNQVKLEKLIEKIYKIKILLHTMTRSYYEDERHQELSFVSKNRKNIGDIISRFNKNIKKFVYTDIASLPTNQKEFFKEQLERMKAEIFNVNNTIFNVNNNMKDILKAGGIDKLKDYYKFKTIPGKMIINVDFPHMTNSYILQQPVTANIGFNKNFYENYEYSE